LVTFFKEVLENKTEVYQKYSDEKLNSSQFDKALGNIQTKNKLLKKREPKPTHHLMISLPIDIPSVKKRKRSKRTKKHIEFCKKFLNRFRNII